MTDPKSEHFTNQDLAELVSILQCKQESSIIQGPGEPWLGNEIAHRFISYEVVTSKLRECCVQALTGKWNRTDAGFRKMIEAIDNNLDFTKDKEKKNVLEFRSNATSPKEGEESQSTNPDSEG